MGVFFFIIYNFLLYVLAPNGAGKTTTIECLLGIKKFDSGEVVLLNQNPRKKRKKIFQKIGVQLQASSYQTYIRVGELCEEIAVLYESPRNYQELLELFHLSQYQKHPVDKLSGGERQKLSIILALIPNPEIIFLDELTTGLDTEARQEVWAVLKKLKNAGLTIFLTTHYMEEAEMLCDYLYLINRGKKVVEGTVQTLIQQSGAAGLEEAYLKYMEGISYV